MIQMEDLVSEIVSILQNESYQCTKSCLFWGKPNIDRLVGTFFCRISYNSFEPWAVATQYHIWCHPTCNRGRNLGCRSIWHGAVAALPLLTRNFNNQIAICVMRNVNKTIYTYTHTHTYIYIRVYSLIDITALIRPEQCSSVSLLHFTNWNV